MMLASLLLHALAYSSTPASFERRAGFGSTGGRETNPAVRRLPTNPDDYEY